MSTPHRIAAGVGEVGLSVASSSHTGLTRAVNEDSFLTEPPVFAVADGMGGHAFGDRASAAAVLALHEEFHLAEPTRSSDVLAAIRRANAAVRELTASTGDERVIAGTTLTGVALVVEHPDDTPQWMVFNLGDSRVYRWHAEPVPRVERLSVDHSLVQELVDAGLIDAQGALTHPDRNIITRALGAADDVDVDWWLLPAEESQTFLICSDGLTKELQDEQIASVLGAASDPSAAVELLLAAALAAGGHDNISLVLVQSEYHSIGQDAVAGAIEEQTRERALSPELEETHPRL